jgi:hypothetical protein
MEAYPYGQPAGCEYGREAVTPPATISLSQRRGGSDYPFAATLYPAPGDPQPALSTSFTNHERRRIDRLNARAQFKRVRRAVPDAVRRLAPASAG